ncbi:hypothetical protein SSX86_032104 [Deinandra increscens subsp. villosa]|uniref:NAB domain-containing protein n=1 Tax=Deinandra increscens subsp. villosa TaxID=3103831 RepID=A0AAP0GI68_9ASTR
MTERATGKGHSWLWASHIRTKQSKWLEQNLQDMEYKVENVLNLIQKDGDSFARRAEMYYKHRPEVISFVEETVRAYRSLAERYDKLSTELQKANTTIASICPEKVTYDDEDDYTVSPSKSPKKAHKKAPKKQTKIPKAPKPPAKGVLNSTSKTAIEENHSNQVPESGSTKDGQDQLKSCEETLEKMTQDAKLEQQKFDEAKLKLESLTHKFNLGQVDEKPNSNDSYAVELGETIDKLVNKMITLETSVKSQTDLTDTLRKENDDLQKQIQNLEAENAALMNHKNVENLESKAGKKEEIRWLQMLLSGLENKDDILLEEFILILKSYKDTKRKLSEEEKRNEGTLSSMKSAIAKRDNTIRLMIEKMKLLQESLGEDKVDIPSIDYLDEPQVMVSASEEKLRMDIDALLNRNLDIWLTFSSTFRQVHKFKTQVKDLQEEVDKVKAKGEANLLSDIKPIYVHLQEINAKLTAWLQQSTMLKDDLDMVNSCLSNIQEELTNHHAAKFSTYEAAKFKGEIWNMKQENNKVNEELEAGLNHAISLKHELEQTVERLEKEFGLSANQNQPRKGRSSRRSMSLKSLIFGGKSKKQKFSLFSCMGYHKRTQSI